MATPSGDPPESGIVTPGRWIKVIEAADQLGVSDETIYRLCRRGRLTYRRDPDTGSWRVDAHSVAAYERAGTVVALRVHPSVAAHASKFPRQESAR